MNSHFIVIPIRNIKRQVIATALVDPEDCWISRYHWHLAGKGYAARTVTVDGKQRKIYMHRELLGLDRRHKATECDHRNKDRLDNRRANLRPVTKSEQQQNTNGNADSPWPRGVAYDRRRAVWTARCCIDGHVYWLGSYSTPEQAGKAASDFRAEYMPLSPDAERRAS